MRRHFQNLEIAQSIFLSNKLFHIRGEMLKAEHEYRIASGNKLLLK